MQCQQVRPFCRSPSTPLATKVLGTNEYYVIKPSSEFSSPEKAVELVRVCSDGDGDGSDGDGDGDAGGDGGGDGGGSECGW